MKTLLKYEIYEDFEQFNAEDADTLNELSVCIKDKYLHVTSTSKQNENLSNFKSNIVLHVDFANSVPGIVLYILSVSNNTPCDESVCCESVTGVEEHTTQQQLSLFQEQFQPKYKA